MRELEREAWELVGRMAALAEDPRHGPFEVLGRTLPTASHPAREALLRARAEVIARTTRHREPA